MEGPFKHKAISNLRCSPIGLVPKKTGGLGLITYLYYFRRKVLLNDFIDTQFTKVTYSSFDNAVKIDKQMGNSAKMAKKNIKSAFPLLKCYPVAIWRKHMMVALLCFILDINETLSMNANS
ncbi:Hypothetical predicted protein [Mytilus galloprovincialis]|uniref:Uncharacterized protein n=1 Tax=Mytilus galloprovincialis TaxID=29158 RepID=A0A8B6BJF5_MYTGA|nr:Hypothetical predicted protein [Mytilus galloprovincialis]